MNAKRMLERAPSPYTILLVILTLLMLGSGCDPEKKATTSTQNTATADTNPNGSTSASQTTATRTSELGAKGASDAAKKPAKDHILIERSETLPAKPERIVSMAPNITEILYALDYGERVVGVTRFCDWPEEAKQKRKVGGFIDPDMEVILSLEPDLVIGMAAGDAKIVDKLEKANIPYAFFKMDHFDATYSGIARVGALIDEQEKADALVSKMRQDVHKSATASQSKLTEQELGTPSAIFVLGHKPLIVAGKGTFGDELITLSGAKNAASSIEGSYPQLDLEKLLQIDPDIIVDATMTPATPQNNDDFWKTFSSLKAVKNKRVSAFADPSLLRPGPRLPEALARFSGAIVPEEK